MKTVTIEQACLLEALVPSEQLGFFVASAFLCPLYGCVEQICPSTNVLSRIDALELCVFAGVMGAGIDFGVTQVVDGVFGIHSIIPK